MTEVPKIVHDRLRAASIERLLERALPGQEAPERAHPDADLLTAFAEQALSATERDGVLKHLSLCGECRDVLALALPASEITAETDTVRASPLPAKASRNWLSAFTAPSLRWAAVAAAGVVIIAASLVVHSGRVNQTQRTPITLQATNASPTTSSPDSPQAMPSATNQLPTDQSVARLETDKALKPEMLAPKKLKAGLNVTSPPHAESPMMLAGNRGSGSAGKVPAAPTQFGANETVEVAAAPSATQVETSSASENVLMAQNDTPPVIKAKPALGTETSIAVSPSPNAPLPQQSRNAMSMAGAARPASHSAATTPMATPSMATRGASNITWGITGGVLQRSLDGGVNWQNVMPANHPLLCYASREQEVWTGGQGGILFRSADSGLTWAVVEPSVKTGRLTSDITHIELRGRSEIVVSTVGHEVWRSADGGRTWEKN
jgi:hypothetical protein